MFKIFINTNFILSTQNDNKGTNYGQFQVGKSKGVFLHNLLYHGK